MIQPVPLAASIHDGMPVAEPLAPHVAVGTFLRSAGGKVVEPDVRSAWMSRCVTRTYTRVHEC
jgi:hypothetical protein